MSDHYTLVLTHSEMSVIMTTVAELTAKFDILAASQSLDDNGKEYKEAIDSLLGKLSLSLGLPVDSLKEIKTIVRRNWIRENNKK